MSDFNEQENFWKGSFGNEYCKRNSDQQLLANSQKLFRLLLNNYPQVDSILEFGANVGVNLDAINNLYPQKQLSAIEINPTAAEILRNKDYEIEVFENSILKFETNKKWNLTFTRGVLIHISPLDLEIVYNKLYELSDEFIAVCEYYNTYPTEVEYRGHKNKLFKRDFAGDLLNKFSDLELVDYGFLYNKDKENPDDDISWFLLRKIK